MKGLTRKFSLLIALIVCLTIGGVYATWIYAGNATVTIERQKGVNLVEAKTDGSLGSYEVTVTDFSIMIDQTNSTDYTPKLNITKASNDGNLTFTFTPDTNLSSDDLRNYGINTKVTFSSTFSYNSSKIFTFPTAEFTIEATNTNTEGARKWTKSDNKFTYTIALDDLDEYFVLDTAGIGKLDTKTKYDAFNTALGKGNIVIVLTNVASLS